MIHIQMPTKCKRVLYDHLRRRYRILYGGRGSAKSWSVARYLITRAASEKLCILCAREIQNSIKDSVYKLMIEQIESLGLSNCFTIKNDTITSVTGSVFIFKGIARNTSGIRSTEGVDICWVEEAEALSAESWRILIPTIRKKGSIIIITFNPEDEKSATFTRFVEKDGKPINNPDYCREFVNYWDNPWFWSSELVRDMQWDHDNDRELWEHIWCGRPKKYGHAIIFKNVVVESFPDAPEGTQLFFGEDFGYAGDPMAFDRMFIMEGNLYITHEAYGAGVELDDLHAFMNTVPDAHAWKITADNARPETISFLASPHVDIKGVMHDPYNIEPCEKGKGSVEDGIAFLKRFKKIYIHPRCKGAIQDFKNYRWKTDKITGDILPIPLDKSNHSPDACRYALEGWMKGGATIFDCL